MSSLCSELCVVRAIGVGDTEKVCNILTACWQDAGYSAEELDRLRREAFHPLNVASVLTEAAKDPLTDKRGWIALLGERVVGIITTPNVDGGVYVDPDVRRSGVAASLVLARDDFRRISGDPLTTARVSASNVRSIGLYQSLGYSFDLASQRLREEALAAGGDPFSIRNEKGSPPVLTMVKALSL